MNRLRLALLFLFINTPIGWIAAALVLLAALWTGAMAISQVSDRQACARVATQSSYQTKWDGGTWWTRECYVRQDNGRWVPLDKWRGIDQ